jgi:hypothetical protein
MDGDTSVLGVTNQARTWISTLQSELVGGHNGELPARCVILVGAYTSALLLELVPADAYSHGQSNGTVPGDDRRDSENTLSARRRAVRLWRWVIRLECVDHVRPLLLRGARPRTMYHLQNITEGSEPRKRCSQMHIPISGGRS